MREHLRQEESGQFPNDAGSVEVITGCMFSGKSDELIRRVRRAPYSQKQVQVFKPFIDNRRGSETVNSYDGLEHPAISVKSSTDILKLAASSTNWIAIDEAQFFDDDLPAVCDQLAKWGKRVIVAGLDADFRGERFGPMDELIRTADKVDKLNAQCNVCGQLASKTQRMVNGKPANYNDPVVLVGASESYEARCRHHHEVPNKPTKK